MNETSVTEIQQYFMYFDQTRVCEQSNTNQRNKRLRISSCSMLSLQKVQNANLRRGTVPVLHIIYPSFKMFLSERNFIKQDDYSCKAKCCSASRDELVLS
jgi:hypothetical protein